MMADFWTRIIVKDWKKNIVPALVGQLLFLVVLICCGITISDVVGAIVSGVASLIVIFGGSIVSILLLPKKYLVTISQLFILPIGVIFMCYWAISSDSNNGGHISSIFIIANILSIIVVVCIRLGYELLKAMCSKLLRCVRGTEQKSGRKQ